MGNENFPTLYSPVPYPEHWTETQPFNKMLQKCAACPHPYAIGQSCLAEHAALARRAQVHVRIPSGTVSPSVLAVNQDSPLIHKHHPWSFPAASNPDRVPSSHCPLDGWPCLELFLMKLNFIYKKKGQKSIKQIVIPKKYIYMQKLPTNFLFFKLTTLGHVSFCPTLQCDKAKPDNPGSPSQQSSLLKNKDKIKWQLLNINRAYQQGWTANSGSHPQVLKAVPKSPNSSHRSPLKNSTKKMNLYFKNKLLRWLEIKAEKEILKRHRTFLHSSSPLGAHHDAKRITDAQ